MPIAPPSGETQAEFMKRCMSELTHSGSRERSQEQKVAICLRIWRGGKEEDDKAATAREPRRGEDYQHYMDNCMDQLDDGRRSERERRSVCERLWRNRNLSPRKELAELLNKAADWANQHQEGVKS